MMLEHEIHQAVEGVMALRPKSKDQEANIEQLRAVKRRRDALEYAKEIQAIENGEIMMPTACDVRHFGLR
ncbi:hypothetical protein DZ860_17060 [Vibrio sinensis]|uniref:Uncharacterized protein n=1 Tax=Vibrio sinensis TaxID=2302434 RepID=A0A3A6QNE7_9VIBR|nr:hypothetical protein [Vibrio sinensis]RJX68703.1 hypothetical protein DZ860_17060 [Vibrio sinensis]